MSAISRETLQRLVLLNAIGLFKRGAFGAKRLHKVVYLAERDVRTRPFGFLKYHYGQWSEELDEVLDQLLSSGFVVAVPLKGGQGNCFQVQSPPTFNLAKELVATLLPDFHKAVGNAVSKYGYMKEEELVKVAYSLKEFKKAAPEDVLLSSNLPERIEVGLSEEEADEIELSLDPSFVAATARIGRALDESSLDLSKATPLSI